MGLDVYVAVKLWDRPKKSIEEYQESIDNYLHERVGKSMQLDNELTYGYCDTFIHEDKPAHEEGWGYTWLSFNVRVSRWGAYLPENITPRDMQRIMIEWVLYNFYFMDDTLEIKTWIG